MKWNATPKKPDPQLGDKKTKVKFALFPTRVDNKWLWLEKYEAILEYREFYYTSEEIVSEGIFTEKYREHLVKGERWEVVHRQPLSNTNKSTLNL